jgi:glycosyltransferase involved in cell wall biosynthesis
MNDIQKKKTMIPFKDLERIPMKNQTVKSTPGLLSVVVPIHTIYSELPQVRAAIQRANTPFEVLLVTYETLAHVLDPLLPHEKIIITSENGRGQVLAKGAREASGDIIVFVHADTILPEYWDRAIIEALNDRKVIGGGFSMAMNESSGYLKLLIALSKVLFYFLHELWGDRALFVRSSFMKLHIAEFAIPMMEDVRLTAMMKKHGRVVLLKEKVITSAATFRKYGLLYNTVRILLVRLWYGVGRDPQKIYEYYYDK